MKTGVPSNNQITGIDPNAIKEKAKFDVTGVIPAQLYVQSKGGTAAITTEASIFTDASASGTRFLPANFFAESRDMMESLKAGGSVEIYAIGTIAAGSTPGITVKVGLRDKAGTFTDYSGSGAITTTTTGIAVNYELRARMWVSTWSATAGVLCVAGRMDFFAGSNKVSQSIMIPYTATASFDTTAVRQIDVLMTSDVAITPLYNEIVIKN